MIINFIPNQGSTSNLSCNRAQVSVLQNIYFGQECVELQALNRGNDDLSLVPVVTVLLVDDGPEIVFQESDKGFPRLGLEFQTVHEEENP